MDKSAQSLPELEHGPLLIETGFVRIARLADQDFGCNVFENSACRLAFIVSRHDGESIVVGLLDAPLDYEHMRTGMGGWVPVQEICRGFYAEYLAVERPNAMPRDELVAIVDRALRRHANELFRTRPNNSFKPNPHLYLA